MRTVRESLKEAAESLAAAGVENPLVDARLLLSFSSGITKEKIVGYPELVLDQDKYKKFQQLVKRRAGREPVSKIIGRKEFWGREFVVDKNVLDPRPDSETLIEAVIRHIPDRNKKLRILDLGTGTGCLLLTLLCEYPNADGVGVDISDEALEITGKNADKLNVGNRAEFIKSNWLGKVSGSFDLVISNPPYIRKKDITALADEVKDFDPILALDGGEDGLDPYKKIIPELKNFLNPGGFIIFECGRGQADNIEKIFLENNYELIEICKDLSGIERCLVAQKIT